MTLLCFLVGHKPLKEANYCKRCYLFLEGRERAREAQAAAEMKPEDTVVIDPDDPITQARWEHERKMRELNRDIYSGEDDGS